MENAGGTEKQELAKEGESASQAAADSSSEGPGIQKWCVDRSPASFLCPHIPSNPKHADVPKYVFFEASWAGCLGCVKKLLEARPGLISEASDNQGYIGLAWAEFGVEKSWGAVLLVSV